MKVEGKNIFITGASSGIGEALSVELVKRGARVIISGRNIQKLRQLKTGLDSLSAGSCILISMDVTKSEEISNGVKAALSQAGRIDILVNNAGISQRSLVLNTTVEVDRKIFETDFFGSVALTKAFLPSMISQGGGQIVVISSMAGKYGFPMRSAYSAAKHALHGFFETLALELSQKQIYVNLICPGRIITNVSINAVTADGSAYGIMDKGQARGMPVEKCARRIVRAIEKNSKETYIGGPEYLLLLIKRLLPGLFFRIAGKISPT
jgi:dehydrogenase/reductase SDR family protein 7B